MLPTSKALDVEINAHGQSVFLRALGQKLKAVDAGDTSKRGILPVHDFLLYGIAAWRITSSVKSFASQGEPLNDSKYSKKRMPAVGSEHVFSPLHR